MKQKKMIRVGEKIRFVPAQRRHEYAVNGQSVPGTILWVHPKRRFVVVEYRFQTVFGMSPPIRECIMIRRART